MTGDLQGILPKDIDITKMRGAFSKREAEQAAMVIVKCLQLKSFWGTFTTADLNCTWHGVHSVRPSIGYMRNAFTCLIDPVIDERGNGKVPSVMTEPSPYILTVSADTYVVRPAFVEECLRANRANA